MKSKPYAWLLVAALALGACSKRGQIKTDTVSEMEPTPTATSTPEVRTQAAPATQNYVVKKGDCLWTIAAKPAVFGDAFQWPLLYRQNRDQILNPDQIEPDWELGYHAASPAEVSDAQSFAKDRAPYVAQRPGKTQQTEAKY